MADGTSLDAARAADLRLAPIVRSVGDAQAAPAASPQAPKAELQRLFATHAIKLNAYYRRSGVGDADAEDLTQEAFARALRGLGQFRGGSKMSTWLWTIAQNLLLEHRRKPVLEIAEHDGEPLDADSLSIGPAPRLMDRRDCVRRGFEAFSKDHPQRAQAVFLAVVEEYTREELAEFLGRSTHAATEYLSQCKRRLAAYIRHCHED